MTATEVAKEPRDTDPRNSILEVVPTSDRRLDDPKSRKVQMATQTATKIAAESSDSDPSTRSRQVVPHAPRLHKR
jgi:hypothetical protein